MFVTASSAYNLRSKRGLPLVNQVLGWIALGEKPPFSPLRVTNTLILSTFHSIRVTVPIRIPDQTQEPIFKDPLVLPRVLGLFCDTFHQHRGAVFRFVFGVAGCVGRNRGCHTSPTLPNGQRTRRERRTGCCKDEEERGWVPAQGGRSPDCVVLPVFRSGCVFWDRQCGFDFVSLVFRVSKGHER